MNLLLLLLLKASSLFPTRYMCTGISGPVKVGDGGASWRLKALARAKQQASEASNPNFGRRVGDIVSEQWGSLTELTAGLTDTRAAHGTALPSVLRCMMVLAFVAQTYSDCSVSLAPW